MRHLLVTNDYPPKIGGIQSYLWELYRRQPVDEVVILTRPYPGSPEWDRKQEQMIVRTRQPLLLPEPWLGKQVRSIVASESIDLVMYDPAVPVGALGPRLGIPYGVILHGAELVIPGRLPLLRLILKEVLCEAALVVTAGEYSTNEAERAAGGSIPIAVIPPGVDCERFSPISSAERNRFRKQYGIEPDDLVVLTLSRLVPRKGVDKLIEAAAELKSRHPRLVLLVAGSGRERLALEQKAARLRAPVRFLGNVDDGEVPGLYAMADVFAMMCRVRWGGLEQEGFGIVFLEAAASGVPQLAGRSGGAAEAVEHGKSGLVVDNPGDPLEVASSLSGLLSDESRRRSMGSYARKRGVGEYSYDLLATRFREAVRETISRVS